MFDSLKGELVNDQLIEGQPEFAKTWLQRVNIAKQLPLVHASHPSDTAFPQSLSVLCRCWNSMYLAAS